MGRRKKYENALIVKDILSREANALGNLQASLAFRFVDLKNKEDRKFLKRHIDDMIKMFTAASKELEEKEEKKDGK